ncbi:UDP-N-acetylmuramoyl-L-alanyl-D-glutamate--2,6-diaminopimelate ligase [Sphingopyxis panaciterrae]|uniref:UDP-N-acetylmuramoyl-L-alanyl-D-glutamate--2, 6-diaminopimelate ligase n=1 Tax=Sphingopyxis panaciterrae TaxID=363841 RepID=UPI00141F9FB2|nr:UDP-N-acetylmuramoyl-L-alanyl-D-glutamate--2,6-diaminopimelate ligase [Sphingopyxis panaciterrae]NIJ39457.1 UDP-N-acetylmuramoyl-L-alanyl-D-glutamate--2,6-diaminopimelate ligase [Sphingopyxis panaciterrae]
MRLAALLDDQRLAGIDPVVTGLAIDHRKVAPGTIFGAFVGETFNGEDFIAAAVAAGAIAVVARPEARVEGAIHVADTNPRRTFAHIAARFFHRFPATCVAVTGTNGKTSTVEMTRQLWRMAGFNAASIGTLGITTSNESASTGLTTPDIVTFLSNMSGLAAEGVTHAAFEASSHGLDQYRTEGLPVKAAAFTNLSHDHLDYHGTMEAYLAAKLRLFAEVVEVDGTVVVWNDDEYSAAVVAAANARGIGLMTVGANGTDLRLVSREPTQLGQLLVIASGDATYKVTLPLIGAYQVANALVSAGLAIATGGDTAQTLANLARLQPVRGRLERAAITKAGAPVYVDYAHTPDAIEAALDALRPHATGRLILVFGAGGDRDQAKRPEMGKAAAAKAEVLIITDDNPRGEDPALIRAAIADGAPAAQIIGDRRAAIAAAIAEARADDIICIAGKGHEQGQIVGRGDDMRVIPFDDVAVAREAAA